MFAGTFVGLVLLVVVLVPVFVWRAEYVSAGAQIEQLRADIATVEPGDQEVAALERRARHRLDGAERMGRARAARLGRRQMIRSVRLTVVSGGELGGSDASDHESSHLAHPHSPHPRKNRKNGMRVLVFGQNVRQNVRNTLCDKRDTPDKTLDKRRGWSA